MDVEKKLLEMRPWMFYLAKRYCVSQEDAEDLVSDVVYKILVNRNNIDWTKPLKPWCLVVMRNTYITKYNRDALIDFVSYGVTDEIIAPDTSEDLTLFKDVIAAIHRCRRKSKSIDCLILIAKGYSYEEISDFLNIPVSTVGSRICYGRKQLYKELNL